MTLRSFSLSLLATGLAVLPACGQQAATEEAAIPGFTVADVEAAPEEWRQADPENLVIFETTKGRIVLELLPEAAPKHAEHFKAYVRKGLYDDTPFHRVLKDFMAQGGDVRARYGADVMLEQTPAEFTFRRDPAEMPLNTIGPADAGTEGLYKGFPITTQAAFLGEMTGDGAVDSWIPHCAGVLSTARLGAGPGVTKEEAENSANSQFFLISGDGDHLDKEYTAKGRVLIGLDVVKSIKLGPQPNGFPIEDPDRLESAIVVADIPEDERPTVWVQRSDIPAWDDRLAAADQLGSDICDLPPVPAVIEE